MESGQSFATSFDAVAGRRSGAGHGAAFVQHAQRVIQSAVDNLRRYDDLVDGGETLDQRLLQKLSCGMTPAQLEQAEQVFESDMRDLARQAASAVPPPAWISSLV